VNDPDLGVTTQIGTPIHMLGTPGGIASGQPVAGADNDDIWGGLGYSGTELSKLSGADSVSGSVRPI
jgi:crotonobetainyl-CoA:carnitine CoA-transferase CaiB-like acyl-CoA transferase